MYLLRNLIYHDIICVNHFPNYKEGGVNLDTYQILNLLIISGSFLITFLGYVDKHNGHN